MSHSIGRAGRRTAVLAILGLAVLAASAHAQARPPVPAGPTPRAGSWEIGGGGAFVGGYDLGENAARLTRNTNTGPGFFDQFTTDSRIEPTLALQARLSYYWSRRFAVEGGVRFGRPVLTIEIRGDTEGAPDTTAEETLDQYVITGSALWYFPGRSASPGVVPFVFGGGGYLRELHEGQELVETGAEYHAGAGLKVWFGKAPRRFGLRVDGGLSIRDGGFDIEDKLRYVPFAGASLVYLF